MSPQETIKTLYKQTTVFPKVYTNLRFRKRVTVWWHQWVRGFFFFFSIVSGRMKTISKRYKGIQRFISVKIRSEPKTSIASEIRIQCYGKFQVFFGKMSAQRFATL